MKSLNGLPYSSSPKKRRMDLEGNQHCARIQEGKWVDHLDFLEA